MNSKQQATIEQLFLAAPTCHEPHIVSLSYLSLHDVLLLFVYFNITIIMNLVINTDNASLCFEPK